MDNLTIIITIIAALVGAAIVYFLRGKQHIAQHTANESETISKQEKDIKEQKAHIEALNTKLSNYQKQIEALKSENPNVDFIDTSGFENEIATLKKQVQDMQIQLEDAEDDLADSEKKFKKKKEESEQLENKLYNIEKEFTSLQEQYNKSKADLENTSNDLKSKTEAIDIINTVLSAKPVKEEDVDKRDHIISSIEDFVNDTILFELKKYDEINEKEEIDYQNKIWQWANIQRKTWLSGKKTAAFVGEFSAGKTSIINRILSQDQPNSLLLPTSSKATTAIPTYISYSVGNSIQFTTPNGELKHLKPETFERIKKDVLEQVKISSTIQYFIANYPNEHLKGLSILDTPGFNSNDKEDAERTATVIRETDVLFWVFDANSGEINQTSINIIEEHLQGVPLYVIINKADTKSPTELDQLENHIKNTIKQAGIDVWGYIRFSQKHDISELMQTIQNVPFNNNKTNFIEEIKGKLKEEIEEAENDVNTLYKNIKKIKNKESDKNKYLNNDLLRPLQNKCYTISSMATREKSWFGFGDNYYKMTTDQYSEFRSILREIGQIKDEISDLQKEIKKIIDEKNKNEEELKKAKEQKDRLENISEDFAKLLNQFDEIDPSNDEVKLLLYHHK